MTTPCACCQQPIRRNRDHHVYWTDDTGQRHYGCFDCAVESSRFDELIERVASSNQTPIPEVRQ